MAAAEPAQELAAEAQAEAGVKKPKKALSAYWIFTNKVREEVTKEVREKNGGKANLGDIAKVMTARWSALSEEDRKEFDEKAAEDKKRYAEEFKVYLEASDPAGTLRNKYAHLIPKKPMTPYFAFSQDAKRREQAAAALKEAGSEANVKQLASKLSEMWKALSAEEKAPYEEKHKTEQAEFLKKQGEWQATPEFAEIEAAAKKQAEQQKEEGAEATTPSKGQKRSKSATKATSPKDDAKAAPQPSPASTVKRAKKSKEEPAAQATIDSDVLAEAAKAGLEGMLKNLASRPEVVATGKTSREVFQALKAAGGLVNPAKRALVGAAGA